jgi:hypothetical protein
MRYAFFWEDGKDSFSRNVGKGLPLDAGEKNLYLKIQSNPDTAPPHLAPLKVCKQIFPKYFRVTTRHCGEKTVA